MVFKPVILDSTLSNVLVTERSTSSGPALVYEQETAIMGSSISGNRSTGNWAVE